MHSHLLLQIESCDKHVDVAAVVVVAIIVVGLRRISGGCGDHIGVMGLVVVLRKDFILLNFVESCLKSCRFLVQSLQNYGCGGHIGVMGIVVVLRKALILLNFVKSHLKSC